MPKMTVTVPHNLGQAGAASRLSGFMAEIKKKYADQIKIVEEDFGDTSGTFAFKTLGITIGGNVTIGESEVKIDCDLPIAAMIFKGRIEKELRDSLVKVLS